MFLNPHAILPSAGSRFDKQMDLNDNADMRKTIVTATLIILAGFLGGCVSGPNQNPTLVDLSGEWVFVGGSDDAGDYVDQSASMSPIIFSDGAIHGQVCNLFNGSFKVEGNTVAVGAIMSTEMYCETPAGLMDLEFRFLSDLGLMTGIMQEGNTLHLTGKNGFSLDFEKASTN